MNGFLDQVKSIAGLNVFSEPTPTLGPQLAEIKSTADWVEKNYQYNKYLTIIEMATVNYPFVSAAQRTDFKKLLDVKILKGDIKLISETVQAGVKTAVYKTPNSIITVIAPVKYAPSNEITYKVEYMDKGKKRKLVVRKNMQGETVKENSFVIDGDRKIPDGRQLGYVDGQLREVIVQH